jgi:hypothetical protein
MCGRPGRGAEALVRAREAGVGMGLSREVFLSERDVALALVS